MRKLKSYKWPNGRQTGKEMQNLQKHIASVSFLVIFSLLYPDIDPKENSQKNYIAGKGTKNP